MTDEIRTKIMRDDSVVMEKFLKMPLSEFEERNNIKGIMDYGPDIGSEFSDNEVL